MGTLLSQNMNRPPEERLNDVESSIMHLQHDVESLSGTLIKHGRTLDELRKLIEKLSATVDNMEGEEQRDPMDEKPPHY